MVKILSRWKDEEVKALFNMVEKYKIENKSLLHAFSEYAKLYGRKKNSVRNYYYQELNNLAKDNERCKSLDINIEKHKTNTINAFSELETRKIIKEILRLKCLGNSVRKACLTLAEGNVELMVRYQNKYRSVLKSNANLIGKLLEELKRDGLNVAEPKPATSNIIQFKRPQQKSLDDKDINALFLGLIKLVKKTATENVEKKLSSELDFSNSTLRKTLVKLSNTTQELNEAKLEKNRLLSENNKLKEENKNLKSEIANFLNKNKNKHKSLAEFINQIKEKQKTTG